MNTKEQELKEALEQIKALVKNVEGKIEALKLQKEDKFAELKEAYKKGAVIQWRRAKDGMFVWEDCHENDPPTWRPYNEYRIKPEDKFADLKEAYKNGADIEYFQVSTNTWCAVYGEPLWDKSVEYRIKPGDKFAELKEAHKKGAVIQWYSEVLERWVDNSDNPLIWYDYLEYRIKPEEEPQPGDVCKFWDDYEVGYYIDVLERNDGSNVPYQDRRGNYYKNAKKITKEEAIELLFGKEENNV